MKDPIKIKMAKYIYIPLVVDAFCYKGNATL